MLAILDPRDSHQPFPDVEQALDEPNGLLAVGGCLSPVRLQNAYRHGIFPWFNAGEPMLWWSPDPRWVLVPDAVKVSRSLGKRLKRDEFRFSYDRAFAQVVKACSAPRGDAGGTWITVEMQQAYLRLHELGLAYSFETWQEEQLVGGLYGVAIGQVFFGESMFHMATDASKAAFVLGCERLHNWGYRLIDCQVHTRHLESLGAREITRAEFVGRLRVLCELPVADHAWRQGVGES
jgi:leucyl/phenylalanyl-tRNA---protein transferase